MQKCFSLSVQLSTLFVVFVPIGCNARNQQSSSVTTTRIVGVNGTDLPRDTIGYVVVKPISVTSDFDSDVVLFDVKYVQRGAWIVFWQESRDSMKVLDNSGIEIHGLQEKERQRFFSSHESSGAIQFRFRVPKRGSFSKRFPWHKGTIHYAIHHFGERVVLSRFRILDEKERNPVESEITVQVLMKNPELHDGQIIARAHQTHQNESVNPKGEPGENAKESVEKRRGGR